MGNTFSLPPSDVAGHTFKFSIPLGTYYLSSSLDLNGIQLMAKDTFLVPANEIVFHTIRLKTPNGMKFTVLDPLGIPVAGANFCVFNSPLVSGYANNTCVGSIFSLPASDVSGHTAKYVIPPGTYYINSSLALGDIPLTAQNTVVVPTGQMEFPTSSI